MAELKLIASEMVGEDELNKAKNQTSGGLQMAMESNTNVAERFGTYLLLLNQVETLDETIERVDAVTARDVQRVAADLLSPDNLRMGIIAPEATTATVRFEELIKG
jgi:predicted Zn-dependent peptidase